MICIRRAWNILQYQKEKKLFKTTKDISKGLKSHFEEVPTAQNTLIWMKDHNFSELKYIKYI